MDEESASPPRALIADDQPDVLDALKLLLKPEGYVVDSVASPAEVLAAVSSTHYDVALIDLNYTRDTTSGAEGLDLVERIHDQDVKNCPAVFLMLARMSCWAPLT